MNMELYHSLYHPAAATSVNTANSNSNLLLYTAPTQPVESTSSSSSSSPNHLDLVNSIHPNTTQMQHLLSTASNSYPLTALMLEKQQQHSLYTSTPSAFHHPVHSNPYFHHHQLSHNLLQNPQQLFVLNQQQQHHQQQAALCENMLSSNNADFLSLDMDEALFSHIQQLQELTASQQPQQSLQVNHLPQPHHQHIQLHSQPNAAMTTLSYKAIAQQRLIQQQQQQLQHHQQQSRVSSITQSPPPTSSMTNSSPSNNLSQPNLDDQSSEHCNTASSNDAWQVEWLDSKREHEWELGEFPQFKACKKRKEFFTSQFETIWYKIPYKYHMLMKMNSFGNDYVSAATLTTQNAKQPSRKALNELNKNKVKCRVEICFEDGSPVLPGDGQPCCMSNTEHAFDGMNLKLGPFQFNICSYKYGYKKFRLLVILSVREGANTNSTNYKDVVVLKSPPFVIKSKKPIARPGSKKQMQQAQDQSAPPSSSASPTSSNEAEDSPQTTPTTTTPVLSPEESTTTPTCGSQKPSLTISASNKKGAKRTRDQYQENSSTSTPSSSSYVAASQSPFSASNMFASNLFDTCESLKLQGNYSPEQHTLMEQQLLTLLLGSMNPSPLNLANVVATPVNMPMCEHVVHDFSQPPTWNTYERELKKMCMAKQQPTDVSQLFGLK
ncbi:hypothetical protein C9374_002844 [Naegleria lovaniensis]|uniref:NDT80 domain-containing protein n=1 Tax=Naegleria lovaniensis TaxID=51637 RepID=A0AA88GUU5_NAELO|nr:uncharacterized protein C9374_002844 [Naegleria lovaniensis]KAG2386398.1 hypothetical protein C9374_002844 [Naegleria lovaniensis]